MEIKKFILKPLVLVNVLIFICFILLPYFSLSIGPWGGVTKTGFGLFWSIFDKFHFLNLILIIVPVINIYMIYKIWKKEETNFTIFKVVMFIILLILFLNIAFFSEKSSIKYVGFGLWVSLILSVVQFFEEKLTQLLTKIFPEENKAD